MMTEELNKTYKALQTEALRLCKYGYKEQATKCISVISELHKATGVPCPNYFKADMKKTKDTLKAIYESTGRTDKELSKKDIRDYVKKVLKKREDNASKFIMDKPGHWLYRALLFNFIKPIEEGETWKILADL